MKEVKIEFHCHSHYSHDSNTSIENIARACVDIGLTHIIVCDHDCFGKTEDDFKLFQDRNITLISAIEFTTKEGVHIVGIHPDIYKLEKPAHFYKIRELITILVGINAYISIPHPFHSTGLIGNGNIIDEVIQDIIRKAHFIEINSYKYGEVKTMNTYEKLKQIIGSDAHSYVDVGAYYNVFKVPDECDNVIDYLYRKDIRITHIFRQKHGKIYRIVKKIKGSIWYQLLLKLFPVEFRRIVKNKLINK